MMAIRQGDWKLLRMGDGELREDSNPLRDTSAAELYNLKNDISETLNLAASNPDKVKTLAAAWNLWNAQMAKARWGPPPANIAR